MITLLTKIKTVMLSERVVMVTSWVGVFTPEWLPSIHDISIEAALIIPIVSAPVAVTTSIIYFKNLYNNRNKDKS